MQVLAAGFCGMLFGIGLIVSGMAQPAKVLNFLDLAGRWDPSLLVVMAAALAVAWPGFALARRGAAPLCAAQADWPGRNDIDAPLIAGAVLFGAGWGLVGFCPGPALVDLASGAPKVAGFVVAMAVGMIATDLVASARAPAPAKADG